MPLSALRPPVVRRISFSPSLSPPSSAARCRSFHATVAPANDLDIVTDSLRETLDAHRSSNRARLIRKVYPRAPAAGLWRPKLAPENWAGYQPPAEAAAPPPEEEKSSSKTGQDAGQTGRPSRRSNWDVQTMRSRADRSGTNATRSPESLRRGPPAQPPWLAYVDLSHAYREPTAYLDAEIHALERHLAPTAADQERVDQVKAEVFSLLEPVVPRAPQVIGSRRTGLALADSGLDFMLPVTRTLERAQRPSASWRQIHEDVLRRVESTLQCSMDFGDSVHLSGKRTLVLSAQHKPTGLSLRFRCGKGPLDILKYVAEYQARQGALRPLYMATRTLLEAHGLFGPARTGGIGSYALASLCVAFLKLRLSGPRPGDHLLRFLRLFGTDIDLQTDGVSLDPPGIFRAEMDLTDLDEDHAPWLRGQRSLIDFKRTAAGHRLCIQDPTDYMNDLGRACTRTPELQRCFAVAFDQLSRACDSWTPPDPSRASSILAAVLQAA